MEQSRTIDTTKMSSELVSILDSGEKIEAIVQFYDSPNELTWDSVESTGAEVISKMSVLHGALISGTNEAISELSPSLTSATWRQTSQSSISTCQAIRMTMNQ